MRRDVGSWLKFVIIFAIFIPSYADFRFAIVIDVSHNSVYCVCLSDMAMISCLT